MNLWINRLFALIALASVYGSGIASGHDYCEARHQHPAMHPNLAP